MDNDTQIDIATIATGLSAPMWVDAASWFGMAAAFGAMVLVFFGGFTE